ncbi:helix-turn-helix domain-containing protein [Microtetraspora malaysiensis]|uniref:helix-turn-helix domain-containing protein n=1 Tax=Microtetraspora malaysiensis TaxID=161358 RepID=UPI003D9214C4
MTRASLAYLSPAEWILMVDSYRPSARLRRLGRELRALREAAGLSLEETARALGWSASKLSRIETAHVRAAPAALTALLDFYSVEPTRAAALQQMAREARKRTWWANYSGAFSGPFVALEDEATRIRSWQSQLVPGLLQTEAYARAVIRAGRPDEDVAEIDRRVIARMARGALLTRSAPVTFHAVISEAAVRQLVGGREVMREQLEALVTASMRANMHLQVLPFSAGAHAGLDGTFVILGFGEGDPDIAYIEGVAVDAFEESPGGVAKIANRFTAISDASLNADDTTNLLFALIKEMA